MILRVFTFEFRNEKSLKYKVLSTTKYDYFLGNKYYIFGHDVILFLSLITMLHLSIFKNELSQPIF